MLKHAENKLKSFWERPEGITGMLTIAAGIGGLWLAAPAILSLLTTLVAGVSTAIVLVVLGLILGGLLYVITDRRVRTLVSYSFKLVMKKITGAVIATDPIAIMELYIVSLNKKRGLVGKARDNLRGQLRSIDQQLQAGAKQYEQAMKHAAAAKDRGMTAQMTLKSRQAMRIEELTRDTLVPLKQQLELHLKAAEKIYDVTAMVIDDLRDEVEIQKIRRETIQASYSMMRAAKEIMHGDFDERALYDETMEYLLEDYNMKMGEIDSFLEDSRPIIDGFDIKNGIYEADALERLQNWSTGDTLFPETSRLAQVEREHSIAPADRATGKFTHLINQ